MSKDELRAGCESAVTAFKAFPPDQDNPLYGLLAVLAPDWLAANPEDDGEPLTGGDLRADALQLLKIGGDYWHGTAAIKVAERLARGCLAANPEDDGKLVTREDVPWLLSAGLSHVREGSIRLRCGGVQCRLSYLEIGGFELMEQGRWERIPAVFTRTRGDVRRLLAMKIPLPEPESKS